MSWSLRPVGGGGSPPPAGARFPCVMDPWALARPVGGTPTRDAAPTEGARSMALRPVVALRPVWCCRSGAARPWWRSTRGAAVAVALRARGDAPTRGGAIAVALRARGDAPTRGGAPPVMLPQQAATACTQACDHRPRDVTLMRSHLTLPYGGSRIHFRHQFRHGPCVVGSCSRFLPDTSARKRYR